jgi:hypothetical protein
MTRDEILGGYPGCGAVAWVARAGILLGQSPILIGQNGCM